ncbi:MAG: methylated-DNA--[protein]-cysteine S-methyltransferase [Pseudomonadota bacterium]
MKAGLDTPIGQFWVEADDRAVISAGWGAAPEPAGHPVLVWAVSEIASYFAGDREVFTVPIRVTAPGLTGRVMQALQDIPFGHTKSYGDLARELHASAQAVGQACGANSIPILVPCHRVIAASGLGGFSAPGGIETKVALLKHERAASLLI